MKRALIITYYWPPADGPGVQRWVKFAKHLPRMGWQPVIFTPQSPEKLVLNESLPASLPVSFKLYRKFFRIEPEVNPVTINGKPWKKLCGRIRENIFIPDSGISLVGPSETYLKQYLEAHPVDVIITTGPPHSMHLIGRNLHRETGIKWIADFRDPWTENFYFKYLRLTDKSERKHRELEQSVLDEADAIISSSPSVQDDFRARTATPVHMIPYGFDSDDFPAVECERDKEHFRIVHTGLLAADGNPLFLWDHLAHRCYKDAEFKSRLQIRLAGRTDQEIIDAIVDRGLEGNLVNLGYLSHSRTVEQQRLADILILPLRQEPEYLKVLPEKIFEYLASRRPVLGIGPGNSVAAQLLQECRAGQMFDWDRRDCIKQFVQREWERWKAGEGCENSADISQYEFRELTRTLTEIL